MQSECSWCITEEHMLFYCSPCRENVKCAMHTRHIQHHVYAYLQVGFRFRPICTQALGLGHRIFLPFSLYAAAGHTQTSLINEVRGDGDHIGTTAIPGLGLHRLQCMEQSTAILWSRAPSESSAPSRLSCIQLVNKRQYFSSSV